jgi:hypothetical protein
MILAAISLYPSNDDKIKKLKMVSRAFERGNTSTPVILFDRHAHYYLTDFLAQDLLT